MKGWIAMNFRTMARSVVAICAGVLVLLAAGRSMCQEPAKPAPGPALYCYVGGTMNPAMEEIVKLYEQRTGQKVDLDPSDSGESMIKAKQVQKGDLIVVHDPFHGALVHGDMSLAGYVMATMEPVIVVSKGNTTIRRLEDMAKPGVKVVVTDPEYSTLGHIAPIMFKKAKITDAIKANIVNQPRSGAEAANAVILKKADVALVWNAVAFLRQDKLDMIPIPSALRPVSGIDGIASATYGPLDMSRIQVTIDVLGCTKLEKAARAFAEFTVSKEAQDIFAKQGFSPAPAGDQKIYDKAAGVGLPSATPAKGPAAPAPAAAPAAPAAAGK
jgi:molybdate transport system substrate-binding protein